jgi:hypothetical protein
VIADKGLRRPIEPAIPDHLIDHLLKKECDAHRAAQTVRGTLIRLRGTVIRLRARPHVCCRLADEKVLAGSVAARPREAKKIAFIPQVSKNVR